MLNSFFPNLKSISFAFFSLGHRLKRRNSLLNWSRKTAKELQGRWNTYWDSLHPPYKYPLADGFDRVKKDNTHVNIVSSHIDKLVIELLEFRGRNLKNKIIKKKSEDIISSHFEMNYLIVGENFLIIIIQLYATASERDSNWAYSWGLEC